MYLKFCSSGYIASWWFNICLLRLNRHLEFTKASYFHVNETAEQWINHVSKTGDLNKNFLNWHDETSHLTLKDFLTKTLHQVSQRNNFLEIFSCWKSIHLDPYLMFDSNFEGTMNEDKRKFCILLKKVVVSNKLVLAHTW